MGCILMSLVGSLILLPATTPSQYLDSEKFSTAFSGIDTPGTSYGVLARAVSDLLEAREGDVRPVKPPTHVAGVEWNPSCRDELLLSPHGPACLFGDICDFWADGIRDWISMMMKRQGVDGMTEVFLG